MALEINRQHTALLAMDFENDIVHPDGAFKDFGFAKMVAETNVLDKSAQLLAAGRSAGITIIYVSVKFRPGYLSDRRTLDFGRGCTELPPWWKEPGAPRSMRN